MREGTTIEEDHMRNRQMIVHWLMAHTKAIEVRVRDGKTYYVMVDAAGVPRGLRPAAGRSAAHQVRRRLRRRARTCSSATAFTSIRRCAIEIVARVDALNLPSYTGFVQPRLEPVIDHAGEITDVRSRYPQDLERQMLEYSGKLGALETVR